jgi:hypothetical protein
MVTSLNPIPGSTIDLAKDLGIRPEVLEAVIQVESSGLGFLPAKALSPAGRNIAGFPAIRFEAHVFWKELEDRHIDPSAVKAPRPDLIRKKRDDSLVKTRAGEWDRLEAARTINKDAADCSASWGKFQIMGFNWKACGAESVSDFVELMHGEDGQRRLFTGFLKANPKMVRALKDLSWSGFAKLYNGPGYSKLNYDGKMAAEYRRLTKK